MFTLRVLASALTFTAALAKLVDETKIMSCVYNVNESAQDDELRFDLEFEGYES